MKTVSNTKVSIEKLRFFLDKKFFFLQLVVSNTRPMLKIKKKIELFFLHAEIRTDKIIVYWL